MSDGLDKLHTEYMSGTQNILMPDKNGASYPRQGAGQAKQWPDFMILHRPPNVQSYHIFRFHFTIN